MSMLYEKSKSAHHRILFVSCHYPGYGGAPTNTYNFVKTARHLFPNARIAGLFLRNLFPNASCIDPDHIGGIFYDRLFRGDPCHPPAPDHVFWRRTRTALTAYFGGAAPDVVFSRHLHAPVYARQLFPQARHIYLSSATHYVNACLQRAKLKHWRIPTAQNLLRDNDDDDLKNTPKRYHPRHLNLKLERACLVACDIMVVGSALALALQYKAYSTDKDAPLRLKFGGYWNMAIVSRRQPLSSSSSPPQQLLTTSGKQRHFALCFVCSHVQRPVKNVAMAVAVFCDPRLYHLRKVVVGHGFNAVLPAHSSRRRDANITVHSFLTNTVLLSSVVAQSRVLVVPSLYDCNPNVVQEAQSVGCVPLVSANVGWSERLPSAQVVRDARDVDEWVLRILALLKQRGDESHEVEAPPLSDDIDAYAQFSSVFVSLLRGERAQCLEPLKNSLP